MEGDIRVGNLYVVLHPQASAALDMLHTEFKDDLQDSHQTLFLWEHNDLHRLAAAGMEPLIVGAEASTIVTIAWACDEKLSLVQQQLLSVIMTQMQPEDVAEPGWWLWDGSSAKCRPWEIGFPDLAHHSSFAKADCHTYAYPWA